MDIATGSISSLPTGPLGYTMGLGFDGEKFLVTTNEVNWFFLDGTSYINAGVPQYYYPAAGGYVGLGYGVGPTYGPDYYSGDWYIASTFEDIRVYSFVDEAELIVELIKEIPIGISGPVALRSLGIRCMQETGVPMLSIVLFPNRPHFSFSAWVRCFYTKDAKVLVNSKEICKS